MDGGPLGEGVVDFAAVLAALRQTGYDGWLGAEHHSRRSPESAAHSLRFLNRLIDFYAEDEAWYALLIEALWPKPPLVPPEPARTLAWRFSGRWWQRDRLAHADRPWR